MPFGPEDPPIDAAPSIDDGFDNFESMIDNEIDHNPDDDARVTYDEDEGITADEDD